MIRREYRGGCVVSSCVCSADSRRREGSERVGVAERENEWEVLSEALRQKDIEGIS
jgi:hypothetical protein